MKTAGQLAANLTRFHVHAPTFSTAVTVTDHPQITITTVRIKHTPMNYRPPSKRYSKERCPSSTPEVPLLLNSRAPSAGLVGRGCRVDATLWCPRVGFDGVFM